MGIQFDIEDVLGAGCLSSIGRALAAMSCLWLGSATGSLGFHAGATLIELLDGGSVDLGDLGESMLISFLIGPLVLFGSVLLPFFFPLVLVVYFTFSRGEGGSAKSWVICAAVAGLLALLSLSSWTSAGMVAIGVGLVMYLGFAGSLGMLAFVLLAWQQRRLTRHLMGIAAENEARRMELAEEFRSAAADREFATGDQDLVPPPASRPEPERPMETAD